jgi:hypothetical protein
MFNSLIFKKIPFGFEGIGSHPRDGIYKSGFAPRGDKPAVCQGMGKKIEKKCEFWLSGT